MSTAEVPLISRELWRLDEVAAMCGIGRTTAWESWKTGGLPNPVTIPGTSMNVWRAREIRAWIAKGMPPAGEWSWPPEEHVLT